MLEKEKSRVKRSQSLLKSDLDEVSIQLISDDLFNSDRIQ